MFPKHFGKLNNRQDESVTKNAERIKDFDLKQERNFHGLFNVTTNPDILQLAPNIIITCWPYLSKCPA